MGKTSKKQDEPKQDQVQPSPALTQPSTAKSRPSNRPATDKATLGLIYSEYVNGTFKSISELAHRYNVHENTLLQRINRENWEDARLRKLKEIEERIGEKAQSIGERYLKNTFERMKRYEKMIDISQSNLGSKDAEGNPVLDPDAINTYTLSEQRINAIAMSALRIPTATSVDLTTKGQSLGESIVTAIAKLRDSNTAIDITMEQAERIAELEVIPDNPKQLGNS